MKKRYHRQQILSIHYFMKQLKGTYRSKMIRAGLACLLGSLIAGCSTVNYERIEYADGRIEQKASRSGLFMQSAAIGSSITVDGMTIGAEGSGTDAEKIGVIVGTAMRTMK